MRLAPSGRKSWSFHYRIAGRGEGGKRGHARRLSLGNYPLVGLAEAREKAKQAYDLAERGIDPAEQKRSGIDRNNTLRFENVMAEYIELHVLKNLKNRRVVKSILLRIILPYWRGTPVDRMTRGGCVLVEGKG